MSECGLTSLNGYFYLFHYVTFRMNDGNLDICELGCIHVFEEYLRCRLALCRCVCLGIAIKVCFWTALKLLTPRWLKLSYIALRLCYRSGKSLYLCWIKLCIVVKFRLSQLRASSRDILLKEHSFIIRVE